MISMKLFIIGFILFYASISFSGSSHGPLFEEKLSTHYEQVGENFNMGTLPSEEDIIGWRSGRCYTEENPDKPLGSLLIGIRTGHSGHIWKVNKHKMADFIQSEFFYNEDINEAIYDDMEPRVLYDITTQITDYMNFLSYAIPEEGSLVNIYDEKKFPRTAVVGIRVRKNNTYLFAETFLAKNGPSYLKKRKKGEILHKCYYFKKVDHE